jgi:hypothetical protein
MVRGAHPFDEGGVIISAHMVLLPSNFTCKQQLDVRVSHDWKSSIAEVNAKLVRAARLRHRLIQGDAKVEVGVPMQEKGAGTTSG